MPWVRSGYCCRCGDCCKGDPLLPDMPATTVEGYCPLFRWTLDGLALCVGHTATAPGKEHPYYLNACTHWPGDPSNIIDKPNCTYTFAWAD